MSSEFHKGAFPRSFRYAKENRKDSTKAEALLWTQLRNRRLHGFKFRRQHPIEDFIADFYCHTCRLVVEIDGDYHNTTEQKEYDKGRTSELRELGIHVIRFTNREVTENLDFVLEELASHLFKIFDPE